MAKSERLSSISEALCFLLLALAFAAIQIIIGGTRMAFSLPSYGILGVLGLLASVSWRSPKPAPNKWCLAITAIFLGYILLRAILSPVPYIARSDFYSVLAGLVVYFFTACIFTSARERMFFICFLLLLALGHAFVGALQFRDGSNFMPISWLQRADYDRRASGFYICPNHLAGLLEVVGVLGLSIACWSRWPFWSKMLVAYASAICYVALILTGSRGGYLSTGLSLLTFAFLSFAVLSRTRTGSAWKIGSAGAVAAILLGVVAFYGISKSPFLKGRAQNTFETTNMRVDLWQGALEQWKLQPIFGTGSGTFLYYGRFFRTDRVQLDPIYTHNDYLNLLAEYGAAGALGILLFLGAHFWRGGQNFIRLGPKRVAVSQRILSNALALNVGALAAVASFTAHSVVDFNLHIPANLLLLAFVFGMLANDGVIREMEPPAPTRSDIGWRLILPALGLILLALSIRLFPGEYFSERARAAVRDWHPGSGIRYALEGLRYDPQNPDLHFRLGMAREQFARAMPNAEAANSFRDEAIRALETARTLAPQEEIYALELAGALDDGQRFAEAENVFEDALRLDPKSLSVRRYYQHHLELWAGPAHPKEEGKANDS
ncbi:MAG: O-antigen ligase family protein [Chthoniobacterales bacterium]